MKNILNIVTVTKNDYRGFLLTLKSTKKLREVYGVTQIVVDSSDADVKKSIIRKISLEKNMKYFYQNPSGISSAFNFGVTKCNSKYVWFLNGGDIVYNNINYEVFFHILDLSSSDLIVFELITEFGITKRPEFRKMWPPIANWVPHPSTMILRKTLNEYHGFSVDYKIAMDGDLWLRMMLNNAKVDLISFPVTVFESGGLSSNGYAVYNEVAKTIRRNILQIMRTFFARFIDILWVWYSYTLGNSRSKK